MMNCKGYVNKIEDKLKDQSAYKPFKEDPTYELHQKTNEQLDKIQRDPMVQI